MKYWHLQMSLPQGRGGIRIDSSLLLKENPPVIGTGEWDSPQCIDFKDTIQNGDVVCVKDGQTPIALCRVIGTNFLNTALKTKYLHDNYRHVEVLEFYNGDALFPQPQGTLQIAKDKKTPTWKFINNWNRSLNSKKMMKELLMVLSDKKQIILQGPPGTGKTYTAKDLAEFIIFGEVNADKRDQKERLTNNEQFKLIQFHPSYTYEDFVRGITAKNINGQIEYITENKVIAELADKANKNFLASKKGTVEYSKENRIEQLILSFAEYIQDEIDTNAKYKITDSVSITTVQEDAFRYSGEWHVSQRMKFKDLVLAQLNNVSSRQEMKVVPGISGLATHHASYFFKVLSKFQEKYKTELKKDTIEHKSVPEQLKYVLIIDEINRANLPSVLGELIYALEYRGEAVNSMYALDGDTSIVIPENLYIIGTMNTADRSVGHIDYAIRRRFAFESLLPQSEVIETEKGKEYFRRVEELFSNEKLSSDFRNTKEDIQIGHSYFMGSEENLPMRMKYEVIPILKEYQKDGIFKEETRDLINALASEITL